MENTKYIIVKIGVNAHQDDVVVIHEDSFNDRIETSRNGGLKLPPNKWISKDKFNTYDIVLINRRPYMIFTEPFNELKVKQIFSEYFHDLTASNLLATNHSKNFWQGMARTYWQM